MKQNISPWDDASRENYLEVKTLTLDNMFPFVEFSSFPTLSG